MPKIIVASKNPVKLRATLNGFQKMFPGETFSIEGVSLPSGVSDQPMSDAETQQGAATRTRNARMAYPDADYCIGIEGGIEEKDGDMETFAWVVVAGKTGAVGKGRTGAFSLPPQVAELVRQGKELGAADDIVFGMTNSKQENGAVGILTHDAIDRTAFYVDAVVLALIPFKNQELYIHHNVPH